MNDKDVKSAAKALAEAWLASADLRQMLPDSQRPNSREEAYAIQDEMARLIARPTLGWKMGATSPAISRREGHAGPIIGRVLSGTVFHSPAEIPAGRFPNARIEGEFAAVLLEDVPHRSRPYTRAEMTDKIAIHPAIEIIGNRYPKGPTPPKLSTYDEIADNGTGWGVVLGSAISGFSGEALQNLFIDLRVDGGEASENVLGDDRCNPTAVAADTANILSARGIGLHRGEFIMTGGCCIPLHVKAGARFTARFADQATITGAFV